MIHPDVRPARALAFALVLALAVAAAPAAAQDSWSLPGLAGGQLTPADIAQGDTIVVVWASWSPRCRDIAVKANGIAERWGSRARVVTVNFQEDAAAAQQGGAGLQPPVYLDRDGTFSKRFAVTSLPGLVVFRGGQPVYQGKLPADPGSVLGGIFQ